MGRLRNTDEETSRNGTGGKHVVRAEGEGCLPGEKSQERLIIKFMLLVVIGVAPLYGQDQVADLRAAAGCGPAETQFNVKVDKAQHLMAQPETGKARMYVIGEYETEQNVSLIGHVTTRVGVDGDWMGANHEGSYLSFALEPGTHRLCADVQSRFALAKKLSAATEMKVEEGKTYFYRVVLRNVQEKPMQLRVAPMEEAEGLLLVSKAGMSASKTKK